MKSEIEQELEKMKQESGDVWQQATTLNTDMLYLASFRIINHEINNLTIIYRLQYRDGIVPDKYLINWRNKYHPEKSY